MLEKCLNKHRDQKIKSPKSYVTYTDLSGDRVTKRRRGQKRYFVYFQERFSDIYCYLCFSMGVPSMVNNFKKEELIFVNKDLQKVRDYLKSISKEKNKSITFSANSLKIN